MNWDHAVSWGRGVWVSVSDIGRAGWVGLAVIYKPIVLNSGPHSAQTLQQLLLLLLLLALRQNGTRDAITRAAGPSFCATRRRVSTRTLLLLSF